MASEAITDIVAEMRGMGNYQQYSGDHARQLADRIEAAWKREREETEKRIMIEKSKSAGEGYADGYTDGVDKGVTGNAAAMREALCEIVLLTVKAGKSISCDVACGIIASKAKHALKQPPRNCDVPHKDGHELWVRWQNYGTEIFPSMVSFSTWLLAPAKEGGAK